LRSNGHRESHGTPATISLCAGPKFGRPKETVETLTVPDDLLDVASMTREERDRLKRELVRANPAAARALGMSLAK
jgi:hypothetical protein